MKSLRLSSSKLLIVALALAAGGCSANKDAFQEKLDSMKREITSVRASNLALQDRLDALEDTSKEPSEGDMLDADGEATNGRPNLEVVHLMPEGVEGEQLGEPSAAPQAPSDEAPTVIRNNARGVAEIQDPKKPRHRRR